MAWRLIWLNWRLCCFVRLKLLELSDFYIPGELPRELYTKHSTGFQVRPKSNQSEIVKGNGPFFQFEHANVAQTIFYNLQFDNLTPGQEQLCSNVCLKNKI